jgi:signal transduction histidine kinase
MGFAKRSNAAARNQRCNCSQDWAIWLTIIARKRSAGMNSKSQAFSSKQSLASADEIKGEKEQAKFRLIITHLIIVYVLLLGTNFNPSIMPEPWAWTMILYYSFYTPIAVILFLLARYRPQRSPLRRISAMVADFGFLGLSLETEPTVLMPLYTAIIWITLGNGMRFGRSYLGIATGFAILTVVLVGLIANHGPEGPYVTLMVLLSVLAIPRYASVLVGRVDAARREADAANIAKSRFLAQASHDLRQPLHAISLFVVSLQQAGLNTAQASIVERIDRSVQGVGRLFRSLLDLSTLDSGSIQPKMEPVAIHDLLTEIIQQNTHLAAWYDCDLRIVQTSRVVLADHNLLTTMVQNLLSNAFKFASGRKILVGCRQNGSNLSLQIWDKGIGIDKANVPLLFDEFYQIKSRGDKDQQGVGLGLAIVARMANLMDLAVSVRSELGSGSCFSIDGLRLLPTTPVPQAVSSMSDARVPPTQLGGMKILLVEDDRDILAATAELIDSWGHRSTAMVGIPAYLSDNYDLLIVDFDLGEGTTGADCIAAVRRMSGKQTAAIVITAHDEHWVASEIDDPNVLILKKPLRPAELRSAIGASRAKIKKATQ